MDMLLWLFLAVLFTIAGLFLLYWKLFYWMDTAEPLPSEPPDAVPWDDYSEETRYNIQYDEPDPSQEVQLPLPFTNRPRESSSSAQKDEEDIMR